MYNKCVCNRSTFVPPYNLPTEISAMLGQSVTDTLPMLKSSISARYPGEISGEIECPYIITLSPVIAKIDIEASKEPTTFEYSNRLTIDATKNLIPDIGDYQFVMTATPQPPRADAAITFPLTVIINPCIVTSYEASNDKLSFEYKISEPDYTTPPTFSFVT